MARKALLLAVLSALMNWFLARRVSVVLRKFSYYFRMRFFKTISVQQRTSSRFVRRKKNCFLSHRTQIILRIAFDSNRWIIAWRGDFPDEFSKWKFSATLYWMSSGQHVIANHDELLLRYHSFSSVNNCCAWNMVVSCDWNLSWDIKLSSDSRLGNEMRIM